MRNPQLDGDRFYANRFTYNKQRDLLGEGTYGKVYRAFDTFAKSRVALKLVRMVASHSFGADFLH
ncbi:hypothetical protein Pmar_PMAR022761 [Perkinsus marinus ATCC 50983]|uniref:Protein kinase domain-containing protein n=1 Tax=Perkinsus marinus (strain ATCC 50983 / TXsc) TaxID=423536 RepID=C5LTI4_PERM5|nr:hypothetical protein Pmar_PMAR022761 [Perkinsus marinus ATCC 50983]EEQ99975.1 hypothetical protein Pmar_PMAR022761 [Perkinsus marinus ATCC 50983]|eukprot:XP_002767258.1 hypothetical protein Pmar_PMAR022761 [Perkinsus marinus ATCC 50983]